MLQLMQVLASFETLEIFTYICAGRQMSRILFPHLPQRSL